MNIVKSKSLWVIVMLISHATLFIIGGLIARNVLMKHFFEEAERADAHVLLGHYTGYRDIAVAIKEGKSDQAKCIAELSASAMFDSLKACVADTNCSRSIEQKIRKSAPEVLGESTLPFAYISTEGGIKVCKE